MTPGTAPTVAGLAAVRRRTRRPTLRRAYPPPGSTQQMPPPPAPTPRGQRHVGSGVALLLAGLVGLVVALWLLLG